MIRTTYMPMPITLHMEVIYQFISIVHIFNEAY